MSKKYNGLHRQQLFHWIGAKSDRAAGFKGPLSSQSRSEYMAMLAGSLQQGLWLKTPREPEVIQHRGFEQPLELAMTCFTEWSLEESVGHVSRYGRMGFGFPKRWVLEQGGQPVTYYSTQRGSSFFSSLIRLLKATREGSRTRKDLIYLLHFTKRIHKGAPQRKGDAAAVKKPVQPKQPLLPKSEQPEKNPYIRRYGKTMPYLEEREWRIVESDKTVKAAVLNREGTANGPKYYLPYQGGHELFTLVLPDNQMASDVTRLDPFRSTLFAAGAPPVSLLSLEDIGTF
jgi:hypothetical protein